MTSSFQDAREAMCNVACDVIKASTSHNSSNQAFSLLVPHCLRLLPIHMLAMMKSVGEGRRSCLQCSLSLVQTAFRAGSATRLDDRAYYLDLCKTLPTQYLVQLFYPDLYPIHTIEEQVEPPDCHRDAPGTSARPRVNSFAMATMNCTYHHAFISRFNASTHTARTFSTRANTSTCTSAKPPAIISSSACSTYRTLPLYHWTR